MQYTGPRRVPRVAARTVLMDEAAAEAYLTRLRRSGAWIDQVTERLRAGAATGRLPVAPARRAGARLGASGCWPRPDEQPAAVTAAAAGLGPAAALGGRPPGGGDRRGVPGARPVDGRVRELLPRARPAEHAGLRWLPGGDADYARAIRVYTTLPLSARELHQTGLDHVAALEARAVELGRGLGLSGLDEVMAAIRGSAGQITPDEAVAAAPCRRAAGRGARARVLPRAAPPPCAVTPMPDVVALAGAAPHYTPPRLDGGRPGTFWFNTKLPTAGTGWDIDVVAFHEAVPGHHLQLSRLQLLDALPALQRQRSLPVFSEGWGLYAEQLAEEAGLYADDRGLLGAVTRVPDARRPAGRRHRAARVRLEPRAGRGVRGGARAHAAGVHGGGDRPVHRHARSGARLPDRQAGDRAAAGRCPPPPRPRVLAARLPRRRPRPRLAPDADAVRAASRPGSTARPADARPGGCLSFLYYLYAWGIRDTFPLCPFGWFAGGSRGQ